MPKIDEVNLLTECSSCSEAEECLYVKRFREALVKIAPIDIIDVYAVVIYCGLRKAYTKGYEKGIMEKSKNE